MSKATPAIPNPKFSVELKKRALPRSETDQTKVVEIQLDVDEREAAYVLEISVTEMDWSNFTLERVQVFLNTAKLPERVAVNGVGRHREKGENVPLAFDNQDELHWPEGEETVRKPIWIRTGYFAAIALAQEPFQATKQSLLAPEYAPADPGPFALDLNVHCLVKPKDLFFESKQYQTHGKCELTIEADVDVLPKKGFFG